VNGDAGERLGRRAVCECGSRSTADELRGQLSACPCRSLTCLLVAQRGGRRCEWWFEPSAG
jgi:hypothetical protein